jgi:putative endonuclease
MALLRFIAGLFSPGCDQKPTPSFNSSHEVGIFGEEVAVHALKQRGYKILYRNWKLKQAEIDLICRDGKTLVFVEVKTRRDDLATSPAEAVRSQKQRKITQAASLYLQELGNPNISSRFDVVEVIAKAGVIPVCRVLVNAYNRAN